MKGRITLIIGAVAILAAAYFLRPELANHPKSGATSTNERRAGGPPPPSPGEGSASKSPGTTTSANSSTETTAPHADSKNGSTSIPAEAAMIRMRFETLTHGATASLPSAAAIRMRAGNSSEAVHETPSEILESGRHFGELAEFLTQHPEFVKDALPTYRKCALDPDGMDAIRGLCTYRLHVYEKEWNADTRADYAKIPASIKRLAANLEGT